MKKTFIASSIALCLGTASAANALTVNVTQMRFNGTFPTTGTLNSTGDGIVTGLVPFFGREWFVSGQTFFSSAGAYTWSGPAPTSDSSPAGPYSYAFSLTANQVAWGTIFNWGPTSTDKMPVLNIMTCTDFTTGSTCTGTGTPMQAGRFTGQAPAFDGFISNASSSAVPIPSAAWLMGSGLLGLAGISSRKKSA